ncbi:MAG: DUF4093 domain-containing protein [Ruminococcaceae bacterium]|nr:DUF4093 domain-containing protein [Oscillospiraceae bacterium]
MNRIRLSEVVVVEGKYDKIRLESVVDALIMTTEGFGIFRDKSMQKFLRRMAEKRGLLILTDSDGAGFVIRNFIKGIVDPSLIKHAYIPSVQGKEKRKSSPSKEGLLGVEGIDRETLLESLRRAGVVPAEGCDENDGCPQREEITRQTLFDDGLLGGENSAERRARLLKALGLPRHMSTNALLQSINIITDYKSYKELVGRLDAEE